MRVLFFPSTGDAYNAVQCDETIKNGDVLIVRSEQVVGLAYTWPIAVTPKKGAFHALAPDKTLEADFTDVFTAEQIMVARALARQLFDTFEPGAPVTYDMDGTKIQGTVIKQVAHEPLIQVRFSDGSDSVTRASNLTPRSSET